MPVVRAYYRNSSDRQAKAGTIAAQRPDCQGLAARVAPGWPVVEYADEGVSGAAPLEERPGLLRLLRELGSGDVVIAFALDRISRSDDEIDRAAIYGAIRRAGARIETVMDGAVDRSTFAGRIVDDVRQEVNAEERRKIAARTAAGKASHAARGCKPQGATPYGLTYDPRTEAWGLHEDRATVMRQLFAGLLRGEACYRIAQGFAAAGHLTPRGRSTAWTARMVWQLATRTTYYGEWRFGDHVIAVPPIVDRATWQAAQAQLLASGRRGLRRTQHVYLCDEGLGRCGGCAGPLHVRWGGRGSRTSYYFCPDKACNAGWRRTEAVDAEVWARITTALLRENLVERATRGAATAGQDVAAGEQQAGAFARKLEQLGQAEAAMLACARRGLVTPDGLERELEVIARERRLLQQSEAAAREEAAAARASSAALVGLQEAARRLAGELGRLEGKERREAVRGLRAQVLVSRERIEVRFRLVAGVSCAVGGCSSACTTGESDTPVGGVGQAGIVVVA